MTRTMRTVWILAAIAACGGSGGSGSSTPNHAVGTYVGGGSMMFGPDNCVYSGSPTVFSHDSTLDRPGPRLVVGAGSITQTCGSSKTTTPAVVPTGAVIIGPATVKHGAVQASFAAHLVADGRELTGEPTIEWTLGHDCDGIATFGPVLGAQDTGGRDRTRTLEPAGAGKCTVIATLTTGSTLEASFKPQAFQAEKLVAVE